MCGIAGIMALDGGHVPADVVRAMTERLHHRGPDDDGYHVSGPIGLGMRRLSIIDVAGGKQPLANEDGTIITVYNGEIYNFPDVRRALEQRGHVFHTRTDTEVIPHLVEDHGAEFARHLNGMFGIAVWNDRDHSLLLARDRLGVKPLYYAVHYDRLYFASELKSILEAIDPEIDPTAVFYYMSYGYIPAPRTIYRNVHKLPAGCVLRASREGVHIERYWELPPGRPSNAPDAELLANYHSLLRDAIRIRLMSDVPLGAFLSGGVDSSLVVALMSEVAGGRVRTFSIRFEEEKYDEAEAARFVAKRFGTQHDEFCVRWDVSDHFDRIITQFDEPFADPSAIPTYFLCKLARQHVTVALSGDGGDETCAGYERYRQYFRKRPIFALPRVLRRAVASAAHRLMPAQARGRRFLESLARTPREDYIIGHSEHTLRGVLTPEFVGNGRPLSAMDISAPLLEACGPDDLDALCGHDLLLYMADDILVKVDRMSMANSLEVREPLIDYRIVEFTRTLPRHLRLSDGVGKIALKRILEKYLPREHIDRPKHGFSVPISRWFRGELRGALMDHLNEAALRRGGVFEPGVVASLIDAHMNRTHDYGALLWRIFAFQVWHAHRRASAAPRSASVTFEGGTP
ncbi:MAG: asparagine synthase (glutamine-hydrolyzing) [Phycisphaerales bacterium]|nr:asparagine synthase (glutamine-hydrolyzing) [Phycisphaerales bacterium]